MNQRELEYALAKQVPDMLNGFTIHTSYGDIVLDGVPGRLLAKHLEAYFREELREMLDYESSTSRDRHGFSLEAHLIGGSYVPHPASATTGAACCAHCGAPQLSQAADQPLYATQPTPGSHQ